MHNNSIEAYKSIMHSGAKASRAQAVLQICLNNPNPMTDRDILNCFKVGSDNLNLVQPRITELHSKGILVESISVIDHITGKTVRTSFINEGIDKQQMSMF